MPTAFTESLINLEPGSFTFALIKPDIYPVHLKEILRILECNDLVTLKSKHLILSPIQARALYYENIGKDFYERNLEFITSGMTYAAILQGPDCLFKWRAMMGCTDSSRAHPETLRGLFGNHKVMHENGFHGSDSPISALRESILFFGED